MVKFGWTVYEPFSSLSTLADNSLTALTRYNIRLSGFTLNAPVFNCVTVSGKTCCISCAITPSSASNKILVTYDTNISGSNAGYSGNIHLKRGSTKIYQGDAEGSRTRSTQFFITRNDTIGHLETIKVHGSFLDSPNTTSETTYKLSINAINTNTTVNKTMYDDNQAGVARVPSTITVMEIAA